MITAGVDRRIRLLSFVLAAIAPADSARAAPIATASVSIHDQYRGATASMPVFSVVNTSTAGETIGSIMIVPPGPDWAIRGCSEGPTGWTRTLNGGACVFTSAAGTQDDIAAGAGSIFRATVDILPGATNAAGEWDVHFGVLANVSTYSPLASGGEGGLSASIWVWEIVNAVVSTTSVSAGAPCPPTARQAVAGSTRDIVICGRNHANAALMPQVAVSSLGGSFIAAQGTFSSLMLGAGFTGALAVWDGAKVTSNPGAPLIVRATIGSSGNATSPVTALGGYNASPPVPAPEISRTLPSSPANANAVRVFGTAAPFTTVRLFTESSCSAPPIATRSAADFAQNGFAVSVLDNTSTTFHATASDGFGTVSACSNGFTFVEDSTAPAFAGLRTATARNDTTIRLAWQAASDTVSPASEIVYDICEWYTSGGCNPFRGDYTTAPGALTFDVATRPDIRLFFVVRARDRAGNQDANTLERTARTLGTKANVSVSAGGGHACALHADGAVTCWGKNGSGEVGRGTSSRTSEPTLVLRGAVGVSASAGDFTCAVISNGNVWCWGKGDLGQLGNGTNIGSYSPTQVTGITDAVAVSAGGAHACALHADGTVSCWGYNSQGELGNGTKADSNVPVQVIGLEAVKAIAAGTQHTCALVFQGYVRCWGYNDFGQLGNATNDNASTPVGHSGPIGAGITAIATGHWHTCALAATGEVYCWGRGDRGQLGNGGISDENSWVQVAMPADAVAVAAGGTWDRGWSCALTVSGHHRCWGSNHSGNFGIGTITASTPTPAGASVHHLTAISAGVDFGCFVRADGNLLCAGINDSGQLGDTRHASPSPAPVDVHVMRASMGVQVSSGARHTCAVISDATARCWGHNGSGRLGNETTTPSSIPVFVSAGEIRSVSAGDAHTCAVGPTGYLWCWGVNAAGQLGDGTTDVRPAPGIVPGLSDIVAVAGGGAFTCALDSRGVVWCFGDNSFNQLGSGGMLSPTPVQVTGLAPAIAITAGHAHACALMADGWVTCWGDNASGQVGPAGSAGQIGFTPGAVAIAAGMHHTCAVLADGTMNCWGANASGQLGDNTRTQSAQPVLVAGITSATAIAAGASHTCARLADTSVQCWGANSVGQLGDGTTLPTASKVVVLNLAATSIDAGLHHTCAMRVDGTAVCWGAGADGRLGNGSVANQPTHVRVTPFP